MSIEKMLGLGLVWGPGVWQGLERLTEVWWASLKFLRLGLNRLVEIYIYSLIGCATHWKLTSVPTKEGKFPIY